MGYTIALFFKYVSWLLAVGVGFAGSWWYEFTVTDLTSGRKRLTRSGKWGAGLALGGLVSALTWTVLDDWVQKNEKRELVSARQKVLENGDALARIEDKLKHAMNVIQLTENRGRVESNESDRATYRVSLESIGDLLAQREENLMDRLLDLEPQQMADTITQSLRRRVDDVVTDTLDCRALLTKTSDAEADRRMVALLAENELGLVVSVTSGGWVNLTLMAASDRWDLSQGFELLFNEEEIRVAGDRCNRPTSGSCRVSVNLAAIESWEKELLTTLALEEIQRVTELAHPRQSISVEPSTASRVRQAFQCVGQ